MKTRDELIEECRQEAARAAGGDVVRASDGTVIFNIDEWTPTKADLEWVDEQLSTQEKELRATVIAAATADAALFVDEFGEALDPAETDWDGEAWAMTVSRTAAEELGLGLWPLYQETLIAETRRIAEGA